MINGWIDVPNDPHRTLIRRAVRSHNQVHDYPTLNREVPLNRRIPRLGCAPKRGALRDLRRVIDGGVGACEPRAGCATTAAHGRGTGTTEGKRNPDAKGRRRSAHSKAMRDRGRDAYLLSEHKAHPKPDNAEHLRTRQGGRRSCEIAAGVGKRDGPRGHDLDLAGRAGCQDADCHTDRHVGLAVVNAGPIDILGAPRELHLGGRAQLGCAALVERDLVPGTAAQGERRGAPPGVDVDPSQLQFPEPTAAANG